MKKLLIIALLTFVFVLPQKVTAQDKNDKVYKVQIIKDKSDKNDVQKTMEIKNEAGELSYDAFMHDGVGYMKIYSGITSVDASLLWGNFQIFGNRGIKKIKIYMSSGGGNAFSGLNMADQIEIAKRKGFNVECHAAGIIASAMVPVFAVCSERYATPGTLFMVHEAKLFKFFAQESKSDIRSQNELMDLLQSRYIKKLTAHSKIDADTWAKYIRDTKWFCSEDALKWGLIDKIE